MITRLILLIALLWPVSSWAAVALDAITEAHCNISVFCASGDTVLSYSHTNSASVTGLVVSVFVACGGANSAPAVSSVTYAGTTLTQLESVNPATSRRGYLYGWPSGSSPATGANNVVVTLASSIATACGGSAQLKALGFSVTGSNTTSQYVDTNINSGTGTSATLTMSSNPTGSLGASFGCAGNGVTSSSEGTIDVTDTDTSNSCGTSFGMDVAPTDASWSFTIPSDSWITTGAVFAESGGGGGATVRTLLLMGVGQ